MSIVDFNTSIWRDKWFRGLSQTAKILFIYLWTNDDKGCAGIFKLDTSLASYLTGIPEAKILDTLSILYPKVKYDSNTEIVWVVKFVKHQFMRTPKISPKIVTAIEKDMCAIPCGHPFIKEFVKYYNNLAYSEEFIENTVSIGYQYPTSVGEGGGEGSFNDINVSEPKKKYGEYKHVLLTDEDYAKLNERFGEGRAQCLIDELDAGIELKGYKYKNHYLAALKWARKSDCFAGTESSIAEHNRMIMEQMKAEGVE